MRRDKRVGGDGIGGDGAAGVESEPADPQQGRSDRGVGEVVGWHRLLAETESATDEDAGHQSRDPRADMHHGSAGEVQGRVGPLEQPASRPPDPVCDRAVHQRSPEHHVQAHGTELHPLGEGAADEGRCDDEEHSLEHHEHGVGNAVVDSRDDRDPLGSVPGGNDAIEQHVVKVSDEAARAAKCQAVAPECPDNGHQAHQEHTLHHHAEDVLLTDQPAVEERQPRCCHHKHKC